MPNFVAALTIAIITLVNIAPVAHAQTLVLNIAGGPPLANDAGTGFLDIVIGEAFNRNGYKLRLVQLPAERGLRNANDGIGDGDIMRIAGLERLYPNLVRVPEKILDMNFVAFSVTPGLQIASWDDLGGYVVGIVTGWKIFEINIPTDADIVSVTNVGQLFTLLDKGRIDVALYSRIEGMGYLERRRTLGRLEGVKALLPPLASREMFIYLNKKHRDLAAKIAATLAALKREGFYGDEFLKMQARISADQ